MNTYKQLLVTNPTIDELANSKVPDICLDEVVVELRADGKRYTIKYFPNDYLGAYGSLASKEATRQTVWELANKIEVNLGEGNGEHQEEVFYFHDDRPNPQVRDRAGVSQTRLANNIARYKDLVESVIILSAVYHAIPESVYANTGFPPEKLDWTQ